MRLPRVRITVRRMIALVAVVAVALFITRELWDGLPPRFVIDGIPGRVERLRRGMTLAETRDIIGLEKSWLRGGTGVRLCRDSSFDDLASTTYHVRPMRFIRDTDEDSRDPVSTIQSSSAVIYLKFRIDARSKNWRADPLTRLEYASFFSDFRPIAEFPRWGSDRNGAKYNDSP